MGAGNELESSAQRFIEASYVFTWEVIAGVLLTV